MGRGEVDLPLDGGRSVTWWVGAVAVLCGLVVGFVVVTQLVADPAPAPDPEATTGWRRVTTGSGWSVEVPGAVRTTVVDLTVDGTTQRIEVATTDGPPAAELASGGPGAPAEVRALVDAYLVRAGAVSVRFEATSSEWGAAASFGGRSGGQAVAGWAVVAADGSAVLLAVPGTAAEAAPTLLRMVDSLRR